MTNLRLLALLTGLAVPFFVLNISTDTTPIPPSLVGRWRVESSTFDGGRSLVEEHDVLVFTEDTVEYRSAKPRVVQQPSTS
jgi:hypothetical protein